MKQTLRNCPSLSSKNKTSVKINANCSGSRTCKMTKIQEETAVTLETGIKNYSKATE